MRSEVIKQETKSYKKKKRKREKERRRKKGKDLSVVSETNLVHFFYLLILYFLFLSWYWEKEKERKNKKKTVLPIISNTKLSHSLSTYFFPLLLLNPDIDNEWKGERKISSISMYFILSVANDEEHDNDKEIRRFLDYLN